MNFRKKQVERFGFCFVAALAFIIPCLPAASQVQPDRPSLPSKAPAPCCVITIVDVATGVVTAKVNATGQTFEFSVTNQALLHSLKIGQGIYANFTTHQVSVDGKTPCGTIMNIGGAKPAPAPPATGAGGTPASQMPASQARPAPCCQITAVNHQTAVVTAKVSTTGQVFEFKVPTPALLQPLQVDQGIYANFKTQQVSLDGLKPCCQIISVGAAPPGSGAVVGGASAQGQKLAGSAFRGGPCCSVTNVGTSNGAATAKINFSGQTFQFKATNQPSLPVLKLGQGVYANFQTAQVSVDGAQWCCQILAVGPKTPKVPPKFRPGPAVRLGPPVLIPRPAKAGPTISTQLRPNVPGQVFPFMQASGGSGVDAANELISLPWPGLSQAFVQEKVVKQLNDSLGSGVSITSGSGSIGVDVSCCGGFGLGSAQVGADWHYDLKLKQQAAPYIDLSSGAPGFRYASLTGEGGNPPGFIARAPLNGGWNFGAAVSLVLDAGIDDHVGQSLDWSVPALTLAVGVLNFSATAAAQLDTSDPSRPKLVKADLSPDMILFIAAGGVFPPVPTTIIPIPITLTLEAQPGSVALKGHFASNAISGLPLNTRVTGDVTLTFEPNRGRGVVTATLGLTGYLEIDLINPINNQNLATQKLDLASLSLPFDLPGDIQGSLAGSNFDFPLLKLIAPAGGPIPITWPPAAGSMTNTPMGNRRPGPGSSGKNGNGVSYDLELGGVTPPPPNPLPDFAGVAQQLEAAMPRHLPYGAILMLDAVTPARSSPSGFGFQSQRRPPPGGKPVPFTYGRLADSAIWTGHYLAAESFRYAATKDPAALARVQEVLGGIQLLFDNTRDAVGQNCVSIGSQRICDYKPVRAQAAGNILSRSVLPSNSSFPYTLDHTLQGYPPDMPARSDGKTPCFYIHPDGGWAVGNRVYQTLAAAPLPQEPSQSKTVSAPTGNQLPQSVLKNPNQTSPTGQFQQSGLLLKPRPLGTVWYGVGCGKDGEDDVVSRDQYVGTMMGLAFAYALVPPVQNQVRQMVENALSYIVQNNWNIPAPPDQVVFTSLIGDFDMQLDYLRIGATVDQLKWGPIYQHFQSASALAWLAVWPDTLDPMNSYFGFNLSHATYSPYLFLESDSTVRQNLLAAYNIMRGATATHKDPYYDLVRILIESPGNRGAIASSPAPSNPNISLSDEIISLLSEWIERWNLVRANVVQKTDSPFPTNALPNPLDIEWLWVQPQHVAVYTGLDGSCQILSTFALPLESRPGDRDYLWENPPFDTGVSCSGPNVGPPPSQTCTGSDPSCRTIATAPYREGPAIDYLLPYWMAVYLGLLK